MSGSGLLQATCASGSPVSLATNNVAENRWVMVYVYYSSSTLKFGSYAERAFEEGTVGACSTTPATSDYISVGGVWDGSTFYATLKGQVRRMEIYNSAVITQASTPSLLDVVKGERALRQGTNALTCRQGATTGARGVRSLCITNSRTQW